MQFLYNIHNINFHCFFNNHIFIFIGTYKIKIIYIYETYEILLVLSLTLILKQKFIRFINGKYQKNILDRTYHFYNYINN